MSTVVLDVASSAEVRRRALAAFKGRRQGSRISFATPELLWKVLTPKRWDILRAMTAQGPVSIREIARRLARDVKAVHGDIHALLDAGLLRRTERGRVEFPFDAVRVDFTLRAA
jgi:predicted transcriptional regulator